MLPYDRRGLLYLDDVFRVALEEWADNRSQYWKDRAPPGSESILDVIDDLAITAWTGVEKMVQPGDVSELAAELTSEGFSKLSAALRLPEIELLALERLELSLADRYCIWPRSMAERALELVDMVMQQEATEPVAKYLRRLSRAYILGLDAEVVILCRAILENAVREWFRRRGHAPPEEMGQRLRFLQLCRVLTPEDCRHARDVWQRGNVAVHQDPDVTSEVLETVKLTLGLVAKLNRPGSAGDSNA